MHIPLGKVKVLLTWFCITWDAVLYRSRMSLPGSPEKRIENFYKDHIHIGLFSLEQTKHLAVILKYFPIISHETKLRETKTNSIRSINR